MLEERRQNGVPGVFFIRLLQALDYYRKLIGKAFFRVSMRLQDSKSSAEISP
jgi:hypothetical protein